MNHLEVWEMETYESPAHKSWLKFCADAESILGHDLDGDGSFNGFSLDEAYDEWLARKSGREYAEMVRGRAGYNPEQNWA